MRQPGLLRGDKHLAPLFRKREKRKAQSGDFLLDSADPLLPAFPCGSLGFRLPRGGGRGGLPRLHARKDPLEFLHPAGNGLLVREVDGEQCRRGYLDQLVPRKKYRQSVPGVRELRQAHVGIRSLSSSRPGDFLPPLGNVGGIRRRKEKHGHREEQRDEPCGESSIQCGASSLSHPAGTTLRCVVHDPVCFSALYHIFPGRWERSAPPPAGKSAAFRWLPDRIP